LQSIQLIGQNNFLKVAFLKYIYIYIYIYINQAVTIWLEGFFGGLANGVRWYFAAKPRLFDCNNLQLAIGKRRRSSFFIDIFWLGKNKFDEGWLLLVFKKQGLPKGRAIPKSREANLLPAIAPSAWEEIKLITYANNS
jgi:hypothetical protein